MRLLLIHLKITLVLLFLSSSALADLTGKVNIDNEFEVYLSTDNQTQGTLIASGTNWTQTYNFSSSILQAGQDYYLHVHARDTGGPAGFIGEFSLTGTDHVFATGTSELITNTTNWNVSLTGWNNYETPTDYGVRGDAPWFNNTTEDYDNARWIWSSDNNNHNEVFFSSPIRATCNISPTLTATGIRIGSGNGATDTVIDPVTEAESIYNAWINDGSPASGLIDNGRYNVVASGINQVDRIDFGGSNRFSTGTTLPYPFDSSSAGNQANENFLVRANGRVTLPAGDYTIYVTSDDGFRLTLDTISGDAVAFNKFGGSTAGDSNALFFNNATGDSRTGGSFSLTQASEFDLTLIFNERFGGDYIEVYITDSITTSTSPTVDYELFSHGALGGKLQFTTCILNPPEPPELISFWNADVCPLDQSTLIDVEGGHNGVIGAGAVLGQNGKACQGIVFTGSDSDVSVPHNADFEIDSGAVSFWVNYSERNGDQGLFSKDANGFVNGGHLHIYLDSIGRVNVRHQTTNSQITHQSAAIATDEWHHIVYSFGANGSFLYVNGQQTNWQPTFTTGLTNNQEILVLGASSITRFTGDDRTSELTNRLIGQIDEVKIYQNQPTLQEVTDWMNENPVCDQCELPEPELVSHWDQHPCNLSVRPAGEIVDNVSGHNGNMLEGAAFTSDGYSCQAIDFDGNNDHILVPHNDDFLLSNGAISVWFNLDNLSGTQALFTKDASGFEDGGHVQVTVNNNGRIDVRHQTNAASESVNTANNAVQANQWHHLVYSFGTQGAKLYLDGQLLIDNDDYFNGIATNADDWVFGASNSGRSRGDSDVANLRDFMEGRLDDIKLYRNQPTDQQVLDWHNDAPAGCICNDAVAEFRFDEGQYNNIAGEVIDSAGTFDGRAVNTQPVQGKLCNALDLTASGTSDYAVLDSGFMSSINDFTISVWVKTQNTGSQTILSGAAPASFNELIMFFTSDTSFFPHLNNSGAPSIGHASIADNEWQHVVWTRSGTQNCLYINKILRGCTNGNGDVIEIDSLIVGQEQDSIGGGFVASQALNGLLDELVVFDDALALSAVEQIFDNQNAGLNYDGSARSCPFINQVHHYEVIHDGQGLTCEAEEVLVRACKTADCSELSDQITQIQLLGDGALKATASFTGSQQVSFNHVTAETLTLSLANPTIAATNPLICNDGVTSTCDMVFTDAGFRFLYGSGSTIANQTAGVAFPETVSMQAVENNNGVCQAMFNGAKTVALSQENVTPSGAGGLSFTVDGIDLAKHPSTTDVILNFDANSIAALPNASYDDAGLIRLHANIDDGGVSVTGSSNSFWVRPAVFNVSGSFGGNPINGNSANSAATHPAGEDFQLQISAVNSNGAVTQNYVPGQIQFRLTRTGPLLGDSVDGQFTFASGQSMTSSTSPAFENVSVESFVDGISTFNTAQYSEVGLIQLDVRDINFGNQGIVLSSNTAALGRFTPHYFNQTIVDNGVLQARCDTRLAFHAFSGQLDGANGAIEYLTPPVLQITAYNKQGSITQNYFEDSQGSSNDYMKLDATGISITSPILDQTALGVDGTRLPITSSFNVGQLSQTDLTQLPAVVALPKGVLHYQLSSADHFVYTRSANSEVAPFTSSINLAVSAITDTDNVLANSLENAAPSGVEIRFGRWFIENTFGPETQALPLLMKLQHFDGTQYITSSDNNCVDYDPSNFTLSNITLDPALTGVIGSSNIFVDGSSNSLSLSPSGEGNQGQIGLGYDVPTWLQFDWDGDGVFDDDPSAIATFGVYRGDDRLLHWREVFE